MRDVRWRYGQSDVCSVTGGAVVEVKSALSNEFMHVQSDTHTHSPCPHATYSKAFKGYRPSLCPLGLALRSPSPFLSLPLTPLPHLPCLCCPRQLSRISLIDLCSPSILHGCYLCAIRLSSPITLASQTNGLYPLFNGTVISPHCLRAIMEGHKATASPSGF